MTVGAVGLVDVLLQQDGFIQEELVKPTKEEEEENQDFQQFVSLRQGRLLSDLFDTDFLKFCRYVRTLVHKTMGYSLADFRLLNRREALTDVLLMALTATAVLALSTLPRWTEWFWGPPLLVYCVLVYRRETMLHSRMHYISNMTGSRFLDGAVDMLLIVFLGVSKEAFYRRHIDEHLSHVSNMARVFGEDWQPFDDLPAVWWLKPWLMVSLLFDSTRMIKERFSYRQLIWECLALHTYLALVAYELFVLGTHYILLYHTAPTIAVTAARLMTGMLTHSGIDARNSFNSCGLFDLERAPGLFKVTLAVLEFLSHSGVSAHPIHHAYSQCPVPVLQSKLKEITAYAVADFPHTRLNRLLSHEVHEQLYARIPAPRWYDYPIQFLVTLCALGLAAVVILGFPLPPILLEVAIIDYRIFFYSTKAERYANAVSYWDSVNLLGRSKRTPKSNGYLNFVLKYVNHMREYLKTHPVPVPRRLYGPRHVYDHNVGKEYVDAWLAGKPVDLL